MFYSVKSDNVWGKLSDYEIRELDLESIALVKPPYKHAGSDGTSYWSFTVYFKYRQDYLTLEYREERDCVSAYNGLIGAIRETIGVYEAEQDNEGQVTPYDPDSGANEASRLGLTANNVKDLVAYANKTTSLLIGDHAVLDTGRLWDVMDVVLEALGSLQPKELAKVQKIVTGRYWIN